MANELDISKIVKGLPQLSKSMASFNQELKETIDLFIQGQKVFDQASKNQSDLANKTNQVKKATTEVDAVEKERLKLLEQLKKAQDSRSVTNEKIKVQLQDQKKINKDLAKEKAGLISAYDKESKRLVSLRKRYKDLAASGKENTKESKALRKEITTLDKKLKGIDSTVGQNQRNVGNYGDAFRSLPGPIGIVITSLKTLAKVIFATPLGWIIGLVAAAGAALKTFFANSEEGQDRWNKITAKGGVILGNFKDGLASAGKGILDFTEKIKESEGGIKGWAKSIGEKAKNAYKNFTNDIKEKGVWDTLKDNAIDAYDSIKNGIKGIVDENKREIAIAEKLAEQENRLNKKERDNLTTTAKLRRDVAELRAKAADKESTTASQRIQLIDEAIVKQNQILNLEENTLSQRVYIAKEQAKLSGSTRDDLNEIAALEVRLIDLQTANAEKRRRFITEQQTAIREQASEFDSYINSIEAENKSFEDSLETANDDITKSVLDNDKKLLDSAKKNLEFRKNAEEELRTQSIDGINSLFDLRSSFRESEIAGLEAQKEAEIAAAEKKGEDISVIEAKYAKKESKLRKKQAIQEKVQSVFNAGITIAEGIIKYASNPLTLPLVPVFAALGAFQLGSIIATPVPEFFKGVENKKDSGYGIVGDKFGREIIDIPGHAPMLSPDSASMMYLPKGTSVIPNVETEQILKSSDTKEYEVLKSIDRKLSNQNNKSTPIWTGKAMRIRDENNRIDRDYLNTYRG